jgi:hypothetical protein
MPFVYLCDKCRAYTPEQTILCPKCASDTKVAVNYASDNIQSDAISLLDECHKLIPACKTHPKQFGVCRCLHCRVERYISRNYCTHL